MSIYMIRSINFSLRIFSINIFLLLGAMNYIKFFKFISNKNNIFMNDEI